MENRQPSLRAAALLLSLVLCSSAWAAPRPKQSLLDLAKKSFAPRTLTEAEQKLFTATEKGEVASMLVGNDAENDPANAIAWTENRTVYAGSLQWLCSNATALALVTHRGIRISGMRIAGNLDLSDVKMTFPFVARNCSFEGNIDFTDARLRTTALIGCSLQALDASRAHFDGDAMVAYLSDASGPISFSGANVEGNLNFECAHLRKGLAADGAKIRSELLFNNGFNAEGEIQFNGATIGGNLRCERAHFTNPGGMALSGDSAKIDGGLFFGGSTTEGEVNLLEAAIGRTMDLDMSQFANPSGRALNAGGVKIGGDLFARNGFEATGEVNLIRATIGGNLECDGAQLSNPKCSEPPCNALQVERVNIGGNVFFRLDRAGNPFRADGRINLLAAVIGGSLECYGAQLTSANSQNTVLNADGCKITGNAFLRAGFCADGIVDFGGATVEDTFHWVGVEVLGTTFLKLESAKFGTLLGEKGSWPHPGNLRLDGLVYSRIQDEISITDEDRTDWLARQGDELYPQPYEQLGSVLRKMGREKEASAVMVGKNLQHRKFTRTYWEWWWYNVVGYILGYGYLPSRAFWISVGLIVIGAGLFKLGYWFGIVAPTKESAYEKKEDVAQTKASSRRPIAESYPRFNALVYSLESFTPLLRLDQSSNWAPNPNRGTRLHDTRLKWLTTGSLLRLYLWLHIILGWILTSLWIGSITGLVKT